MTPSLPGRGGGARPDALRLRTPLLAAALAAALSISFHAPLDGQAPPERVLEHLQASDPAAGDLYGCALSLDGTTLLVGSLLDDDRGPDSGSAYVYDLEPGGWAEGAKLVGSRTGAGDRFGFSVHLAREGNVQWALAGAPLAGAGGAGFLFARGVEGGEWRPAGRFDSPETGSDAGTAVALAGGRVLLGAPLADAGGWTDAGAVLVFPRPGGDDGGGSSPVRLEAPELGAGAGLGWSLDAAGDRVAAGAPWADAPLTGSGAVVLFRPTAGGLERLATVTAPDAAAFDAFGYSVALAGDLLVVGAPLDDDRGVSSGAVYLFRLGEGGASLEAKIPGGAPGDQYGTSAAVAADARSFAVGLRGFDDGGPDVGAVDLFERRNGGWVSELRLRPDAARPGDEVGIAVDLSGDGIAAGAYKDDGGGSDAGAVYVLAPPAAEPPPPPPPPEPEPAPDPGEAVATKAVEGSFVEGGRVVYEIVIANVGGSPLPDTPADELVDPLPPEIALVSTSLDCSDPPCGELSVGEPAGAPCTGEGATGPPPGAQTVVWNGAIPPDGFVQIVIEGMIRPQTRGTEVANRGFVCFDPEGDGSTEQDGTVPADGGDGATSFTVSSLLAIPALGPAGLGLLAALLAGLALSALRLRG